MTESIDSIADLRSVALSGDVIWSKYGNVSAAHNGDLVILNYTSKAQFANRWNWFERVSRGLILNVKTGEIVARPFDKFWNWGEGGRTSSGRIVCISEKLDGSLGILYRDNGKYAIATRGSFPVSVDEMVASLLSWNGLKPLDIPYGKEAVWRYILRHSARLHEGGWRPPASVQAVWATRFINMHHNLDGMPESLTLLFEIIYPENRIVVDYGDIESLILLAARDRETGKYLYWRELHDFAIEYGFMTPKFYYEFNNISDILEAAEGLDESAEGWVVEFSDGQRFKIKGDRYKEIHGMISDISVRRIAKSTLSGSYDSMLSGLPSYLASRASAIKGTLDKVVDDRLAMIDEYYNLAPRHTRKEFALWVQDNVDPFWHCFLFARLDGRDIRSMLINMFADIGAESVNGQ